MASPLGLIPTALAQPSDFVKRFPELASDIDPEVIGELLLEATTHIEDITDRRLAPFSSHIYSDMLIGVFPDEYGADADLPVDIYGALGISKARALGSNSLVRSFWLDHFAPHYPELWSYSIESMTLKLTYGNTTPIDIPGGQLIYGPNPTDGRCWLRLGTFAPVGSMITVVYSGGYTGGVPASLKRACLFQAAVFAVHEAEQQLRSGMSLNDLNALIVTLLAPWARE